MNLIPGRSIRWSEKIVDEKSQPRHLKANAEISAKYEKRDFQFQPIQDAYVAPPDGLEQLNDEAGVEDVGPAGGRHQLVDDRPLLAAAEPLEPDHARGQHRPDDAGDD